MYVEPVELVAYNIVQVIKAWLIAASKTLLWGLRMGDENVLIPTTPECFAYLLQVELSVGIDP